MKRFGAFVLVAVAAAASGCASAKYVEKRADGGVVAVPDDSDSWPGYNRRAALEKIREHVGPNYEIVDERKVVTGQTTLNNQQTATEHTLNARNPAYPTQRQTTTGTGITTQQDVTQWQIAYRRKEGPTAAVTPDVRPAGGLNSAFNRPVAPASGGADCNH